MLIKHLTAYFVYILVFLFTVIIVTGCSSSSNSDSDNLICGDWYRHEETDGEEHKYTIGTDGKQYDYDTWEYNSNDGILYIPTLSFIQMEH